MVSKQRAFLLESALTIERNLSILLSNILSIGDVDNSKTLGNKSSALSFSTKVDILLDTDYICKYDKAKFTLFMEMRNQFAHNKKCETYLDMLNIVDGSEKRLLKFYPVNYDQETKEDQLQGQITMLVDDLTTAVNECYKKYVSNLGDYISGLCNSELLKGYQDSFIKSLVRIDEFIDFPITPENLGRLKDNLFVKIRNGVEEHMAKGNAEVDAKILKRKFKPLE